MDETNESGTVTLSVELLQKLLGLEPCNVVGIHPPKPEDDQWDDDSYFGGGPDWNKL